MNSLKPAVIQLEEKRYFTRWTGWAVFSLRSACQEEQGKENFFMLVFWPKVHPSADQTTCFFKNIGLCC